MKATLICAVGVFTILALSSAKEAPEESVCACPRIYEPVCASNGHTYNSDCEFKCATKAARSEHLRIIKYGHCEGNEDSLVAAEEPVCACPRIYRPVCASNGHTYGNDCEFKCAAKAARSKHLRIIKYGRCEGEEEPFFA